MRYILYILTLALVFSAGMMVGNTYLPEHGVSLATAVSAPDLDNNNPILSATDRANAEKELAVINEALQSCPQIITTDKDLLINHIKLWLALEDFQIKRSRLELEIAKNVISNRPTMQFVQATSEYNAARATAEKLANQLFPATQEIFVNPTQVTTLISTYTAQKAQPVEAEPAADESPKTDEQPAAETQPETATAQPAQTQEKMTEVSKADTPKADAAKADTPKAETGKAESVKTETGKAEEKAVAVPEKAAPKTETSKAKVDKTETPKAESAKAKTDKTETPKADVAKADEKPAPAQQPPAKPEGETNTDKK